MTAVVERGLVEAVETTLFLYPAVHGLVQDLGIPGLRGRITKVSHALANLCGDARFSERESEAMIEKVRQRYGDLAFGWVTGPSTRPADLPRRRGDGDEREAPRLSIHRLEICPTSRERSFRHAHLGDELTRA